MSQSFKDLPSKPKPKSTASDREEPSEEDIRFLLELFKYRNIAWRYLLCYCLPLQQKILVKQLRIAHDRRSSISQSRRNSYSQNNEQQKSKSKNIFASLFEDTTTNDSKYNNDDDVFLDEEDDDIPDFYHLPRISIQELHTMFRDGRRKYDLLKKIYITDKQQVQPIISQKSGKSQNIKYI